MGPPFAVTTHVQEPEDTVSVSFQRNPRGNSAETLGHMAPGQLVSRTQPSWYPDFKNRHHPHMLGVVLSVLRAAGRAG